MHETKSACKGKDQQNSENKQTKDQKSNKTKMIKSKNGITKILTSTIYEQNESNYEQYQEDQKITFEAQQQAWSIIRQ